MVSTLGIGPNRAMALRSRRVGRLVPGTRCASWQGALCARKVARVGRVARVARGREGFKSWRGYI